MYWVAILAVSGRNAVFAVRDKDIQQQHDAAAVFCLRQEFAMTSLARPFPEDHKIIAIYPGPWSFVRLS